MVSEQPMKGYARRPAEQAVDLVMPGSRGYPAGDMNGEVPAERLAETILPGQKPKAVQIGVEIARAHRDQVDTRVGDRMRARYAQEDAAKRADLIRGVGSGEIQNQEIRQGAQGDPAQTLGLYGKRMEAVLEGLAQVVEELPGYRTDRQAASAEVAALREELLSYRRELSGVLSWIDAYKSGDIKRLEQQRQITGEQFGPIRQEVQGMKDGIREQIDENFQFFKGVTQRMDELTGRVEEFLGVISSGYRGQTEHLASAMDSVRAQMNVELDSVRRTMETQLGKDNLGKHVFDAVVRASDRGHTMINYDSLGRLSEAAVQINEAAGSLGDRLKYLEKTQSDIRRMRNILRGMRKGAQALAKDREMADRQLFAEVDQINDDIKVDGKATRHTVVRAVARADLHDRERYQQAYKVLGEIKASVAGIQNSVAEVIETAVDQALGKYRSMGFTDEQVGQIGGIMLGGILGSYDNMPDSFYRRIEAAVVSKFEDAFMGFAKALGEKGVKMSAADKKDVMGPLGELTEGVTAMAIVLGEERGNVDRRLTALEKRLPTEDLLTEKGVRNIVIKEVTSHSVRLINDMNLGKRIDGWVGQTAEAAAKKAAEEVAARVSQAVEKAIASRPPKQPRPEGEKRPRKAPEIADARSILNGLTGVFRKTK